MPPKQKAEKYSRRSLVVIERAAQSIKENVYKMRAMLVPGLDEETVDAATFEKVQRAESSLNKILDAVNTTQNIISEIPVAEDLE